jgi:hypothetical protein
MSPTAISTATAGGSDYELGSLGSLADTEFDIDPFHPLSCTLAAMRSPILTTTYCNMNLPQYYG